MFFECNLPLKAPEHMSASVAVCYENAARSVNGRTAKLQKSYDIISSSAKNAGMKPETFQEIASAIFKSEETKYGHVRHFDGMSPEQLASAVSLQFVEDVSYDRTEWPNTEVLFDTAFATVKEWEYIRHIGIGGSDASVIEGTSKYVSKLGLYHDKVGSPVKSVPEGNQAVFDRGHYIEDNVINEFCRRTGSVRIRDTRMFRSRTHPHCIADCDAILSLPDGSLCVFEAKTTVAENNRAWEFDKVPPYYVTQCHHYPAVLNDDRISRTYIGCIFTVDSTLGGTYIGSQYRDADAVFYTVERDADTERDILDANERFWDEYIEQGIEPPMSYNLEIEKNTVKKYFAGDADPSLPAKDLKSLGYSDDVKDYMVLQQKIADASAEVKRLEGEKDRIKLRLISALGDTVEGTVKIDDKRYYEVKYKPKSVRRVDCESLQAYWPEVYAQTVRTENSTRIFSVSKKRYKKK